MTRLTLPHPSSLFGMSLVPMSSAPRISIAFTRAPWGSGLSATSIRYSLTRAEAPAAAGVAIEVPLYSTYQSSLMLSGASEASWALHDLT